MYRKYKLVIFFLITGWIITGCRHEPEVLPSREMLVKTLIVNYISGGHGGHGDSTIVIHPDTTTFTYDSNGVLLSADSMRFFYNPDGTLRFTANGPDTIRYAYNNGLLVQLRTNCGYYDGGSYTDTTTFFYSGSALNHYVSTHENATTDVVTKNGHTVKKYVSRKAGGVMRYDTLVYTWNNGNLVNLQTIGGSPNIGFRYEREFRYDNHTCYVDAIHYPEEYLFVREITQFYGNYPLIYYEVLPWRFGCKNNPVEFTEHTSEQTRTREWHIHYNEYGYVVEIHAEDFEVLLEYY
ncbi:MAG: hypothetical protein ACM3ME_02515 [Chloroflexota bacterium]|nr:hypothetical protein [Lentimicrobium sp.]